MCRDHISITVIIDHFPVQVPMMLCRLTRCLFPFTQQANATPPHDLNELELSDANDNTISVWVATPDLTVISFTATNPEAIKGSWAVYNDTDYQGTPIIINPDSAVARPEVVEPLFTNSNTIQSVKPLIGQIILYKNFNYTGDSLVLTESTPNLGVYGWNDAASSARVICGKWELYQGTNYQSNHSTTSGDPEALSPIPGIPNDSLSSVKFIPEA